MLSVTFLGTSAARPTVERNVSATAVVREGETLLFECGEGTQRQMMRYGVSFALADILVTHFHTDHFLGIIGLLRTLGLQGREEPMRLYGPKGARRILEQALALGVERAPFEVQIAELTVGDRIERKGYDIVAFATEHGRFSIGYALIEHERLGRFDPEKARALGIPEGPLWGKIHRGEAVEYEVRRDDGSPDRRIATPEELVGPPRPGRKLVYTGDTRPCKSVVDAAEGADLLIHEATFGNEEKDRAVETEHSTALEAAQVALAARVRQLALNHLSARYSADANTLLEEARTAFAETVVARDGMVIDVAFRDAAEDAAAGGSRR
ncbi:MAG: ribonuclease Z [Gemmatimonadetes bacterium RBG_16_66_8]|nr:MAG: ribonuclease Z [Gemmatimonadetes bacterium RBG_16_66_8]